VYKRQLRRRLAGYLSRRGFDGELVMEVLRALDIESEEEEAPEG
jgi:SOS response regulatory protein OraA/RecX